MIASLAALCTEAQAAEMIASSAYALQLKADGKRILVGTSSTATTLLNRHGQTTTVPTGTWIPPLPPHSWVDFEFLWDRTWVALDLLRWDGVDYTTLPAEQRYRRMAQIIPLLSSSGRLTVIPCAFSLEEKTSLLVRLRLQKAEGLIFRRANAPYSPGLINAGGPLFKLPWRKRGDFVIMRKPGDEKRAFEVFAYNAGTAVNVGRVTAHGYYDQVPAGTVAVVELEYLYASKDGRLVQPTIIRLRTDKTPQQCLVSQMQIGGRHAA